MKFQKVFNRYLVILFLLCCSLLAVVPLLQSGFFPMHDDTQVARVQQMGIVLKEGIFPVRWVPDLGYGYGYPIFNYYAPLPYYVGGTFTLFGIDNLLATKLMMLLGALLAVVSMYVLAREFWGKSGGFIAALLYMYAPYHAVNLYVRGAIGELWGYGLIPLVFFSAYKLYKSIQNHSTLFIQWMWVCSLSFSYALVIISHNLTAFMVTPFLFVVLLLLIIQLMRQKKSKWYLLLIGMVFGIILSAFYWLPAMMEMQYTNVLSIIGGKSDYKDHFVCFNELLSSPWGFAGSAPGCVDGMSFKIGKLHIILGAFSIIPFFFSRKKKEIMSVFLLGYFGFLISLFMTIEHSKFIWDAFPKMAFFQFPWRFLVMTMFFLSFFGGAIVSAIPKRVQLVVVLVLAITILFVSKSMFLPSKIESIAPDYYTSKQMLTWTTSKISDEYMPIGFLIPKAYNQIPISKITIDDPSVTITITKNTSHFLSANFTLNKQSNALLAIAYFPSWKIYLDDKPVSFTSTKKGLLVSIPPGTHELKAQLSETNLEQIANTVSLTGVIVMITGIIYLRKPRYEYKKTKR